MTCSKLRWHYVNPCEAKNNEAYNLQYHLPMNTTLMRYVH